MWCLQVRKQLSAYADGELAAAQARGVEEHLSRCAGCRGEHEALVQLVRVTTSLPIEEVPAGLHSRILTRLAYATPGPVPAFTLPAQRSAALPWFWPVCAGATAALVLGAVLQSRPGVVAGVAPAVSSVRSPAPRVTVQRAQPAESHPVERPVPEAQPLTAREVAEPVEATPERVADVPEEVIEAPEAVPAAPAVARTVKRTRITGTGHPAPRVPGSVLPEAAGQPLVVAPVPERPEGAPRLIEPASPLMTQTPPLSMPGDPVINSTAVPQPEEPGVPEPGTRMAGMSMVGMSMESSIPAPEDEGLRQLQMFIEERNRTVPQPPVTTPKKERKGKKS